MTTGRTAPPTAALTRSEWGLIVLLAAIQFTHLVDFVIIMPLGDRLMRELSLTTHQFGHVVSAYGFAAAAAGILAAFVIDRFDRRRVILAMYAGFTVSTLLCGLAGSYEALLAARGLAGTFGGLAGAGVMAVVGDAFPPEKRGRAGGAVMSAFAVASIVGLPIGLGLANWLGRGAPFIALAGVCVAVWALVFVRMPAFRGHLTGEPRRPLRDFARVVAEPRHLIAFLWTFVLVHGSFTIIPFLGPYMVANAGRADNDLPWIYGIAGACTLVSMNVLGRLSDRFGKRPVFYVMAVWALLITLAITNLPAVSLAGAVAMAALLMVGASGRMVPAQAMLIGAADPRVRGAFMSLNTAVQHMATGVAPMIAGAIMVRQADGTLAGYPTVGLVAAGFAVASIVLAEFVRPAVIGQGVDAVGERAELKRPAGQPAGMAGQLTGR